MFHCERSTRIVFRHCAQIRYNRMEQKSMQPVDQSNTKASDWKPLNGAMMILRGGDEAETEIEIETEQSRAEGSKDHSSHKR